MDLTATENVANLVVGLTYEDLPKEVVEKAKRVLLDSLGVAIAAFESPSSQMVRSVIEELGGKPECTIIGSGKKTSCLNALLANVTMVRYHDFMDSGGAGHPSERIPTILAVGEREHSTGRDIIMAIVLAYELGWRWLAAMPPNYKEPQGWHHSTANSFIAPITAGKLLGLTVNQMVNALGISIIGHGPSPGMEDASDLEYSNLKNIIQGLAERDGVLAALLAQKGFTGHKEVYEHPRGIQLMARAVGASIDPEQLYSTESMGGVRWQILRTKTKYHEIESSSQGLMIALKRLVRAHNIWPKDVKAIRVKGFKRCVEHNFSKVKRYPVNKETADHSAPFGIAAMIMDHELGPDQFIDAKIKDPTILDLIGKVSAEYDPAMDAKQEAEVEIETVDGKKYKARSHWIVPMPDETLEEKFRLCTSRFMPEEQIEKIIKTVYNLEKINDIGELMDLLVI